jgi:hypothetical protein
MEYFFGKTVRIWQDAELFMPDMVVLACEWTSDIAEKAKKCVAISETDCFNGILTQKQLVLGCQKHPRALHMT